MIRFSLEGKLLALALFCSVSGLTAGAVLTHWAADVRFGWVLAALVCIPLTFFLVRYSARPVTRMTRALTDSIASFRDGDFSVSLATRRKDELGELVSAFNEVGNVLRAERQDLYQRELMLDTVIQSTPTALVLTDAGDRIVYCNMSARRLFLEGRRLEGHRLQTLLANRRPEFVDAVRHDRAGIYGIQSGDEEHQFHISYGHFTLNARPHRLFLFKQLTRELTRQEVATWKKVIRVISHELNNSLAPITSLAHSGRELVRRGENERLDKLLGSIGERANSLKQFIEGYSRFAKLPAPTPEMVDWAEFLATLHELAAFTVSAEVPDTPGWFDPGQLQQVMLNLLKNATEAGSPSDDIEVEVSRRQGSFSVIVRDRGSGMPGEVQRHALLPFYSTKKTGSGLGLSLCREIIEAHGGRISIANRHGGGLEIICTLPAR